MRILASTAVLCVLLLGGAIYGLAGRPARPAAVARSRMPLRPTHFDHAQVVRGPYADGPAVTEACLQCHPDAARQVMATSHWTWAGQKVKLPGRDEVMRVGKRNVINNFCIHAGPNLARCTTCHVGYGWKDDTFDFTVERNVDCLICHEQTGMYEKDLAGEVAESVDLTAAAQSVGRPTRTNCGQCHFKGGGGDAVKHGDLDGSMYQPTERLDVHMGRLDFSCVDCHRTQDHVIPGCAMSVCIDRPRRVNCTDCHPARPHGDERLDAHTAAVACQTCHIPRMAIDAPTKMWWDWSQAGQEGRAEDPHQYLKAKGSFRYAQNVRPEHYWYNGRAWRYLTGDTIDPAHAVAINHPLGGRGDPDAKIWPFKVHRGKQPYDKQLLHLLAPRTWGPGGYWTEFNWDQACRLGSESTGLAYSGQYDFVETAMYWPLSHMVQPKERAVQCNECHGGGLLDWQALGYEGDPAFRGGRQRSGIVSEQEGANR